MDMKPPANDPTTTSRRRPYRAGAGGSSLEKSGSPRREVSRTLLQGYDHCPLQAARLTTTAVPGKKAGEIPPCRTKGTCGARAASCALARSPSACQHPLSGSSIRLKAFVGPAVTPISLLKGLVGNTARLNARQKGKLSVASKLEEALGRPHRHLHYVLDMFSPWNKARRILLFWSKADASARQCILKRRFRAGLRGAIHWQTCIVVPR